MILCGFTNPTIYRRDQCPNSPADYHFINTTSQLMIINTWNYLRGPLLPGSNLSVLRPARGKFFPSIPSLLSRAGSSLFPFNLVYLLLPVVLNGSNNSTQNMVSSGAHRNADNTTRNHPGCLYIWPGYLFIHPNCTTSSGVLNANVAKRPETLGTDSEHYSDHVHECDVRTCERQHML